MKTVLIRSGAVVLLALSGPSFLDGLFPSVPWFLAIIFSLAVVLSLSDGFVAALPSVIAIGIVADIAMLDRIGMAVAFSAGLAYAASFFSRRLSVEHGVMLHVFAGTLVGFGTLLFPVVAASFPGTGDRWEAVSAVFRAGALSAFPVGMVAFAVTLQVTRRFREWLSYFDAPRFF